MEAALQQLVWQRAGSRCEYCQLSQVFTSLSHEVDHIIAVKHGGTTTADNLALACFYCNSYKGPNIAGRDPLTGKLSAVFHPRRHPWRRYFRWEGATLVGRTPIGRTTIAVLEINHPDAVAVREELIAEGVFPPA